ncbi:MAG: DUF2066 domain-containing protein [Gammaproteobacteria bacterium]|nr:DUF2066 domain-containing protein [Gammaproteobacteria bacterium]
MVILITMLVPINPAWSATVTDLYQAEVPISGEETAQRSEAISRAFGDMLIKVTGNRRIVSRGGLKQEQSNASQYVQQYSYRLADSASQSDATSVDGEPARLLQVFFDRGAVDRLLTERGLPVWSGNRPSILIWAGVEQKGNRRLLVAEEAPALHLSFKKTAANRGLPVVFPLMDLEDQGSLQVADLWGDFESNIRAASNRYGTDLILTSRLVKVGKGLWRGNWSLYQGQSVRSWDNQGKSSELVAADGIQQAGDLLADKFAPFRDRGARDALRLRVSGLSRVSDYTAVTRLLGSLGGIDLVSVVSVEPDAAVFKLKGRSDVQALEQGLRLGGLVEPDPGSVSADSGLSGEVDLYYRLR